MTKRLIIGLTGGIGSGKSAAAAIFAELGVRIVNADQVAREVVEPGSDALAQIAKRFGEDILLDDGSLDRAALRKIVFSDPAERQWLEALTHPLIGLSIVEQLGSAPVPGEANYRILESPLLMETQQKDLADRLCLVDVSEATQIARVMVRDQNSEEQVKAIIATQMGRNEKRQLADDIIDNDGDLAQLKQQVVALHERYQGMAEQ